MANNQFYKWSKFSGFIKRLFDILFSIFFILILSPIFILLILITFITIGKPIFYLQERVGENLSSFNIIKFRTMRIDAEENGPQLAQTNDDRVVGFGKIIRKWRLDEMPQFFNVLKGDMSFVGPRPEREIYVNQLINEVPDYSILFNVKPGITSLGMVNYGYASNLSEMKKRAVYDINYIKKLELFEDLKVLFKTVLVIIDGRGK